VALAEQMRFFILAFALSSFRGLHALEIREADLHRSFGFVKLAEIPSSNPSNTIAEVVSSTFDYFRRAQNRTEADEWARHRPQIPEIPAGTSMFVFDSETEPSSTLKNEPVRVFSLWKDGGFEVTEYIIVTWKKVGKNLTFDAILDRTIPVGIGITYFKEIHQISKQQYLIIGGTSGGDAGDVWGSIWVGLWSAPRKLQIVYEAEEGGSDAGEISKLEYKFDRKKMSLRFRSSTKGFDKKDPERSKEKDWTVDLNEQIKKLSAN
jgi:hypothetical protein